jgi:micrococcal nuclease
VLVRLMPARATIRLEGDVAATDRYGRPLAWVWIGGTLVNEAMVRDGWAARYTVPANVKYADRIERAQNEACVGSP